MATTERSAYHVTINAQGRVVLPAELRREAGIEAGDRLCVTLVDGAIVVRNLRHVREMLWAKYRDPSRDMTQEIIDERRAEAAAERAE